MMRSTAALLAGLFAFCALPARADTQTQEAQIGQKVYSELKLKGEIIPRSSTSYYGVLDPIATRIKSVADAQYATPFTFILVHEAQPNAFAVPGGNVYVTDSLVRFVRNREELAGVLCHETAHDIHHDVINENRKSTIAGVGISILAQFLGDGAIVDGAARLSDALLNAHFSRSVEANADATGAFICARAGMNPWGMVWLFEDFEQRLHGGRPEIISDHPSDAHRIAKLERLFKRNPATFGSFNPDARFATPIGSLK